VGSIDAPDGVSFTALTLPAVGPDQPESVYGQAVGKKLHRDNVSLQLLRANFEALSRIAWRSAPSTVAAEYERHLLELLRLSAQEAVSRTYRSDLPSTQKTRLAEILTRIDLRCREPDLSPDSVARDVNISRRYLFRLLEASGISFSQRLLNARLAVAFDLLRAPGAESRLISDVSFSSGFSDLSHFNRSFRERYGMSPSKARNSIRFEKDQA
jgi:AraC-like DNA-binding protein